MKSTVVCFIFATTVACSDSADPNGGGPSGSATGTGTTGSGAATTAAGSGSTATTSSGSAATTTGATDGTGTTVSTSGSGGGSGAGSGSGGGAAGSAKQDAGGGGGSTGSGGSMVRDGGGSGPGGLAPAGGACPTGATFGDPLPLSKTAVMVQGGFSELEGPVWVASQNALYFCEMGDSPTTGRIHKYTPADGKIAVFVENVGIGGLALDPQGMLVAASYDTRRLTRFDPANGQRSDVAGSSMYMGTAFDEVNDVVVRSDGNMYFSDPNYASPKGTLPMSFYRLSPPPESAVTRIVTGNNANGIALSPDGAWLYMATTDGGPALRRVALAADGSAVGAPVTWTDPASDGMAVDCAGNLYLSVAGGTNQIKVVSPTDQALGSIVGLGGGYVTNSAFGDADRKTLYITTSTALYKIQLNVPGFPN